MSYHPIPFPDTIDFGSEAGPAFETKVQALPSGSEQFVTTLPDGRLKISVAFTFRTLDDVSDLEQHFRKRDGCVHSFPFHHYPDSTSAANGRDVPDDEDQEIGIGDGTTTSFQLIKKYTDPSIGLTRTRNIRKPKEGTVVVAIDGVATPTGWSLDWTTGILTFTVAPALGEVITVGFENWVPVRYGEDIDFDGLRSAVVGHDAGTIANVSLIEVLDPTPVNDDANYGGATALVFGANIQLALGYGRLLYLDPTTSGLKARLPATTGLPLGETYFMLVNAPNHAVVITNDAGTTLWTLAADEGLLIGLGIVSSVPTWLGLKGA